MFEELEKAGLTTNESKVYLALLDLGPSNAGKISRKSGLHRRNVYDATERLIEKGLIGYIKQNNKRLFKAASPNRFLEILKEKENILSSVIPSLLGKYSETKNKEETNFFKGKEGLKAVLEDQLNSKEILVLGGSPMAYDVFKFYFHWYDKSRKEKKIKMRMIASDKSISHLPLAEIKYLPEEYTSPVAVNIYDDKVAIILWASSPLAIVIKNPEIAKGYRNYFELMWKIAKK